MTRTLLFFLALAIAAATGWSIEPQAYQAARSAQAYRARGEAVAPAPDGAYYCEAEEFRVRAAGWQARPWGENYYANMGGNTFLSRKAFLGAPEQVKRETRATLNVNVREPGRYLVLARYEAAYRFETQFTLRIEQDGREVFRRQYGARSNVKVWGRDGRPKLQPEIAWTWGAVENIVWEGHDAFAELKAGKVVVTLIAGKQPEPAAKRNVDLIMLTRDEAGVKMRIEKEHYLPLDGLLTQAGDVFLRVTNPGEKAATVTAGIMKEHSPYWVHLRTWKPVPVTAEAGKTSEWVDVGGTLDTLNDGQWTLTATAPCRVEVGVKNANGRVAPLRSLEINGKLTLVALADFRYTRRLRTPEELQEELMAYLRGLNVPGKPPTLTPVYQYTFDPGVSPRWDANTGEFKALFGLTDTNLQGGYVDWRGQTPAQLKATCEKLTPEQRAAIRVVSLGDEIGLPSPGKAAADAEFVPYLQAQGLAPAEFGAADWGAVAYSPDTKLKETNPALFYWSQRFRYHYGIRQMKALTDVLREYLPNAGIGANFSPHHGPNHSYLGHTYQWVTCFREGGFTLPWGEDWAWQVPIATPQINGLNLDLFRAGLRGTGRRDIIYYVMAHDPGLPPAMWKRMFYNALAHGATIFDLFEFRPVWAAYTENYVNGKETYKTVLLTLRELAQFEDIVQTGRLYPAEVGLWFSETADIWDDNTPPFGAAKRSLYAAILQQGVPLDVVVEGDDLEQYKVIYLTDRHVSLAASRLLAKWVQNGGRLFATAGAGMYDEYHRPNTVLQELMGVKVTEIVAPPESQVNYVKQDLPFAKPVETVGWLDNVRPGDVMNDERMSFSERFTPAYGNISRITARQEEAFGFFADKSPALVYHSNENGAILYCAFLPSLSYFAPAIPRRPVDRTVTEDGMCHFLPTRVDTGAGHLIANPLSTVTPPVICSNRLVETTLIEAKTGTAVVLNNWSGKPVKGLTVQLNVPAPANQVSLASGRPVQVKQEPWGSIYTLDLDVADALILR